MPKGSVMFLITVARSNGDRPVVPRCLDACSISLYWMVSGCVCADVIARHWWESNYLARDVDTRTTMSRSVDHPSCLTSIMFVLNVRPYFTWNSAWTSTSTHQLNLYGHSLVSETILATGNSFSLHTHNCDGHL